MSISELLKSIKEKALRHKEGATAAWDAFKGNTGMIPKEEQTIGNLKYAIRMNQKEMDVNEINFVDFNGMVLSMTIEEVMQLTEMPKPNEYYNLTFEKWSETLEEIQDGRCHTVGAFYHTTDGCNYYVVEVESGGIASILINGQFSGTLYWGDGNVMNTPSAWYGELTHTYEKAGIYTIKWEKPTSFGAKDSGKFKEIYLAEGINIGSCRYMTTLKKLCVSSSATGNIGVWWGPQLNNLKALIVGDGVKGFGTMASTGVNWKSMEYLVANGCSICELRTMNDLKAFSCKNATTMETSKSYLYERLRYVVFDNMKEILSTAFYGGWGNYLLVADLPETLESIGNKSFLMNVKDVYLRPLTPPTLGGTNVFWNAWWGNKTTIHIRKEATYTDANGDTWTGLEAYAHATNWASLYTNTNFTFIDDL